MKNALLKVRLNFAGSELSRSRSASIGAKTITAMTKIASNSELPNLPTGAEAALRDDQARPLDPPRTVR